jgi:hypothetical protein
MDINTDRRCENCGHDWRGDVECPVCGHLDNLGGVVTLCAWCSTSAALTAEAHAQGLETTHGMCEVCAVTLWTKATEAKAEALRGAR